MQTKSFSLPGGARVGVMVTILLEVWTDRAAPPYSPMTTALKPGTYDRAGVSWARYGLNNGVWRLTRILDSLGIKGTVCTSAKAIEQAPDTLRSVIQRGHEVAAHSYTQDTIVAYLSPAEELENMQRCIRIFEEHLQQRPAGWISPVLATTDRTTDFVCQEGFLWHGDYNDIDMPAIVTTEHGSTVALPHTDFADNRVLRLSPNALFDAYKGTFDYLYRQEPGSVVNLTVHCQFGGRPLISSQVYEILRYFQGFPDVWFARHDEMATWFKQTGAESIPYTDRFAVGGTQ